MAKSDGSKFGKTAGGSVWLDAEMTSPYAFYQFWINTDDADVEKYLKVFSFKDHAEIERLIETVKVNPGAREAQRELARELTSLVHASDECEKVEAASKALFGQGELKELDEKTLAAALSQLPKVSINKGDVIPTWVDLLTATGVVDSKSAARRIVKENGAYLNNEKIVGEDFAPTKENLIHGRFLVLRKGKRDLASVEIV
jgi:tyrosyl-tRNA synthetase